MEELNLILEEEFSGYKIYYSIVVPIANDLELQEVQDVISHTLKYPDLHGVELHMNTALKLLAEKRNPDYRNSIKEAISAVEALCRKLTSKPTLGKGLNALESKGVVINREFKNGLEKIYGYTNNKESGIRHAIIDSHRDCTFEEAKFMLVSCSAFVNYLISTASKNGVNFLGKTPDAEN